ncbi:hypothetical protein AAE478_007211 [Parahypoxylon ruwenzoriense]
MADPKPLKDKVILVTGAAQGLGGAIARYIAARGAVLSLADVAADKLEAAAQSLAGSFPGVQILTRAVDVCDAKSVENWVAATKEKFGRIDGCVNNAGIIGADARPITELSEDAWALVINVNLTGMFHCLKYQLRAIEDGGSIVNMSSTAGLRGMGFYPAYVASKHGIVGLTKVAATQSASRGIRVNAVCPSVSNTPMWDEMREQIGGNVSVQDFDQLFQRFVTPEEVASFVAYLLGDESKFMTRTAYPIDGGFVG